MNLILTMLLAMRRGVLRCLTMPLAELRARYKARLYPIAGGAGDVGGLLAHYKERLGKATDTAATLSEQISVLLKDGALLDDERVVPLMAQRQQAFEDVEAYRKAIEEEQGREEAASRAAAAAESVRPSKSAWVAPSQGRTDDGPTPFRSFGEQLTAIAYAARSPHETDPRLLEIQRAYQLGLSEGVPSEGGFLVQVDFATELLRRIHETGKLIGLPRHIPLSERSNGLKINAIDEASRVDGSRLGGVQAYWTAEAATITKSKPTFRQIELSLHKLAGLYYATDEELADTAALEETVASFFAEELGFKLDDALIRGTGAGEPLGILGHAGTVSVAKEAGQVAATIVVENIERMYSRMWARSIQNALWLINQDCWPQIFALGKAVGVGGVPVFLPPGGLSVAPFGTLLGREIRPIEQCEALGTVGDIILADFRTGYVMIDKGGIQAASSIHVQFLTDESVFRFILRTDGQPIANTPLTPYKGTATQSSFVTLATRA